MAVETKELRTKAMRIFEADHGPVHLLAGLERRSAAEVVHAALAQYLRAHRTELAAAFRETQKLLAVGDIDGLTRALRADVEDQVEAAMAKIQEP